MLIVPHCQSEHHINGMVGGWTDWPLTEHGRNQAKKVARSLSKLQNIHNYIVYSSDLLRAYQTAEICSKELGLKLHGEESFREINMGTATGKSDEWFEENANQLKKDEKRLDYREVPGAESRREVQQRIYNRLNRLEEEGIENLLVFTHGYASTMFIAWFLRLSEGDLEHIDFSTSSGSITELMIDHYGYRTLRRLGDTSHLHV
jgi:broad specificity phosphatase PhoE